MNRVLGGALLWLCGILLLPACQRPAAVGRALTPPNIAEVEPGRFDRGRELLEGFTVAGEDEHWGIGDSVLLGIAMDAPGISRTWYMRATVLGLPVLQLDGKVFTMSDSARVRMRTPEDELRWVRVDYGVVPVAVELFDGHLELLAENQAMMPDLCLRWGLVEFIELGRGGVGFLDGLDLSAGGDLVAVETQNRFLAGWLALTKLPDFLHRDSMKGLVWQLVDRPSLLSIVRSRGVTMSLDLAPELAEEIPSPRAGIERAYRVPMHVTINGEPAMVCSLLLARPTPPLGPASGLLGLDAENPRNPAKRITVRLLAAERSAVTREHGPVEIGPPETQRLERRGR
jgi:hypothetical protein